MTYTFRLKLSYCPAAAHRFCWNANSADTGGLVADDWESLVWHKINWMVEHMGLKPWWLRPSLDASKEPAPLEESTLPAPMYANKRPQRVPSAMASGAAVISKLVVCL